MVGSAKHQPANWCDSLQPSATVGGLSLADFKVGVDVLLWTHVMSKNCRKSLIPHFVT